MSCRRKKKIDKAKKELEERERRVQQCWLSIPGVYDDVRNWMRDDKSPGGRATVDPRIEDQGPCPICWAFVSGRAAHAACMCKGHEGIPPFAIQDIIDHTYPGVRDSQGGNPLAALQYMKIQGVSGEDNYGPLTGYKPDETPPPQPGERYTIKTWNLVQDDETSMLACADQQPLIVSVPAYAGVILLNKKALLDLVLAEEVDDVDLLKYYYDQSYLDSTPDSHTMLLVGYGTFYPSDRRRKSINYWILKNQWNESWGDEGIGYFIRNSSLSRMYKAEASTSQGGGRNVECLFTPTIPRARDVDEEEPEEGEIDPEEPSNIIMNANPAALAIEIFDNMHQSLFFAFYDPEWCQQMDIKVCQVMAALEKAYEFDYHKIFAIVDITIHQNSFSWFKFDRNEKFIFIVFKDKKFRSKEDGIRFPLEPKLFDFGNVLNWLGEKLDMAPFPTLPTL